METTVT